MRTLLCTGNWDADLAWEFFLSDELPPVELCTAASCVGFVQPAGHVVLTRTHRGWECLGGHIEDGETLLQTMCREALEEGGLRVEHHRLLGYRKITSARPIVAKQTGKAYPTPYSYVPWFIAVGKLPLLAPTGDEGEVHEARAFALKEVRELQLTDQAMVEAAMRLYMQEFGN